MEVMVFVSLGKPCRQHSQRSPAFSAVCSRTAWGAFIGREMWRWWSDSTRLRGSTPQIEFASTSLYCSN